MTADIKAGTAAGREKPFSPERLIIALDYSDPGQARALVKKLQPLGVGFKVGLELFLAGGPALVKELARQSFVFLDLKFHDIPNTVAAAVKSATTLGVQMLNIHAAGGKKMLKAAREALPDEKDRPILLAVTVLTSMDDQEMAETGCHGTTGERVLRLAHLSAECGLDGVVCSPLEIDLVKNRAPGNLLTVTPGIRLTGDDSGDQVRIATPDRVIEAGGDFLVVGRPVTRASDPLKAVQEIFSAMQFTRSGKGGHNENK